jgi:hypothetical protein
MAVCLFPSVCQSQPQPKNPHLVGGLLVLIGLYLNHRIAQVDL